MTNNALELYDLAEQNDIIIINGKLNKAPAISICDNGDCAIIIDDKQIESQSDEVTKLAHELGHGCHMRLSSKQGDLNDATPLTLAEVASVFAEMLTFQSLLRQAKTPEECSCSPAAPQESAWRKFGSAAKWQSS